MSVRIERFEPANRAAFDALHSDAHEAGWCKCVAWWVPTWEGWGARSAEENATLRDSLCDRGEFDGLLAFDGDEAVGWCQIGPRDRLEKLVAQLDLEPDPDVWAVTCFLVPERRRRQGIAAALLTEAIAVARAAGAARLEAYPRMDADEPDEMWTGPADLFLLSGLELRREGTPRSVLSLDLRR